MQQGSLSWSGTQHSSEEAARQNHKILTNTKNKFHQFRKIDKI